jgi:predicted ATP-binding protein involved in virulence
MKLSKLRLENFRRFEHYDLELRPWFNLLIGDNGKGKTSLLEGLCVGLSNFLLPLPVPSASKDRHLNANDARRVFYKQQANLTAEPQYPVTVRCEGSLNDEKGSWECQLPASGTVDRTQTKWLDLRANELQQRIQNGTTDVLPVLAYYGTERLWRTVRGKSVNTIGPSSRFAGYEDCLNSASNEQRLLEWFKSKELAALQQRTTLPILEGCRVVIIECVPDCSHVYFDVAQDQLVLTINGGDVPFSYLSDGYRNMLAMVADICVRCCTLNPHLGIKAPRETPGVVLIDEIDLHLHPKWQRRVVGDLIRVLPGIQFVATSHSPFVIQSLPQDENVQLVNLDGTETHDVHEMSVEDVAEYVQGVELPSRSRRFVEMMQTAEDYFKVLKKPSDVTDEQKSQLRANLDQAIRPFRDPGYSALLKMQEIVNEKNSGKPDNGTTEAEAD